MPVNSISKRAFLCSLVAVLVMFVPVPAFADEIVSTLEVGDEIVEANAPTIAEFEHYGPRTPDTSKAAISQAATHIATPEQARRAEEATMTVVLPSAANEFAHTTSAGLVCTGDAVLEGSVVALGGLAIVAFSLLLYHFRKE